MIQFQLNEAKAVTSFGVCEEQSKANENISEHMKFEEASRYRMFDARMNYLASDRPDIQHAVKGASENMAKPQLHHWSIWKRICKYQIDSPRVIQHFRWQRVMDIVVGHSDSDWADDQKTKKSTSGGVCRIGPHVVKTWSSTKQMIALSSSAVEFYVLLKCVCQTFGIMNLALDFGIKFRAVVHIDARVAFAVSQQQGLGQFRHIDVRRFWWLQERIKAGDIKANKVNGTENLADLMAKHLSGDEILKRLGDIDFEVAKGRADKSLTPNIVANVDVDQWVRDDQCFIRRHNKPRRTLCDLFQCRRAPKLVSLTSIRITHGEFIDGTKFIRQDNWTCNGPRNLDIGQWWTGRIAFVPEIHKNVSSLEDTSEANVGFSPVFWFGERLAYA